jgi:hypothetical protein
MADVPGLVDEGVRKAQHSRDMHILHNEKRAKAPITAWLKTVESRIQAMVCTGVHHQEAIQGRGAMLVAL